MERRDDLAPFFHGGWLGPSTDRAKEKTAMTYPVGKAWRLLSFRRLLACKGSAEGDCGTAGDGRQAEHAGNSWAKAGYAEAERNAGTMQGGGCDQEAEAEGERTGRTQFTAMGMAVEEGEEANDGGRGYDRQADGGCDQKAKADDRGKDRRLDKGQADAGHGKAEADGHHRYESGGNGDKRAATDLACPDTHGDHGQDVVGAEERMGNAGHQRAMGCRIQMGKGRTGRQRHQGSGE